MATNETTLYTGDQDAFQNIPAKEPKTPPALGNYKFSNDELRVMKECNSESFYQRSLPIGSVLGFGTFAAMQKGFLKPSSRFGPYPKVTFAVIVGYFIGKLSYQQACADKLMALPGSYIGQLLRERRDGRIGGHTSSNRQPTMFGAGPGDIYSDAGPGSSLDLDTDRPIFGDDTSNRPNVDDSPYHPKDPPPPGSSNMSYDELRQRNRKEYSPMSRPDPYRMDQRDVPPISRGPPPPVSAPSHKNKYGDDME